MVVCMRKKMPILGRKKCMLLSIWVQKKRKKSNLYTWEKTYKKGVSLQNNVFSKGYNFLGLWTMLDTFEALSQIGYKWKAWIFCPTPPKELFPALRRVCGGSRLPVNSSLDFLKHNLLGSCPENTLSIPFVRLLPWKGRHLPITMWPAVVIH